MLYGSYTGQVPPRYYDLIDGDTGMVIASDSTYRNRARSVVSSFFLVIVLIVLNVLIILMILAVADAVPASGRGGFLGPGGLQ